MYAISVSLELHYQRLGRFSESPFILNCPTTGLPSTYTFWYKSGESLTSGGTYHFTRVLRDRQTSSFDNFLLINQTLQQVSGIYDCTPRNVLKGPILNISENFRLTDGNYKYRNHQTC